ncbi:MAG: hypothetical protein ABIK65_00675 [Candidatus Eisenbacteria bacterium]
MLHWILALLVTVGAAYYQRTTGPTYPEQATAGVGGYQAHAELLRSHEGEGDLPVVVDGAGPEATGRLFWRRYRATEQFRSIDMSREGDGRLTAALPHQPPAGKLEYKVVIRDGAESGMLPNHGTTVARFKGGVPAAVLLPHILAMFAGMLFSNRAGLEALRNGEKMRVYALWSAALLTLGGMIFGPIVQKYAFGALWTGVPYGWDLTDNKTLIAFLAWGVALLKMRGRGHPRWWIFGAAVVTFVIFLIPHSMFGSELKYE